VCRPVRLYNRCVTVRRLKTYTGSQGYVYQYYFVGSRPASAGYAGRTATEYVFDVTSDRKTTFSVSVFLQEDAVSDWASNHGRELNEAERYAAAKLRLFRGFDEIENMMADGRSLPIDASTLENLLLAVGVT
jgi:hypothetical protein